MRAAAVMRSYATSFFAPLGACPAIVIAAFVVAACSTSEHGDGFLASGTWGGDDAGAIVSDTLTHVHIGCTYGDVHGRVTLDDAGHFSVEGTYLLRAFPVAVGPVMPARFNGTVSGSTLTLTVIVNDTINDTTVTRGPVKLTYGREPTMGPCPICRTPGDRSRMKTEPH